jgi:hypothetical protein
MWLYRTQRVGILINNAGVSYPHAAYLNELDDKNAQVQKQQSRGKRAG